MFNLSGSEIVVILLLALIVLGPDKLPEAMRKAGKTWAELRKLSSGFQEEVRKGFDEPTAEVRQTANAIKKAATLPKNPVKGAVKSLLDPPKPHIDTTATEAVVAAAATLPATDAVVDNPSGTVASDDTSVAVTTLPVADDPADDVQATDTAAVIETPTASDREVSETEITEPEVTEPEVTEPAATGTAVPELIDTTLVDTTLIDLAIADGETPPTTLRAGAPIEHDEADATS